MGTPHKHATLIKAWADGADIETKTIDGWRLTTDPVWSENTQYRVKPKKVARCDVLEAVLSYEKTDKFSKHQAWNNFILILDAFAASCKNS